MMTVIVSKKANLLRFRGRLLMLLAVAFVQLTLLPMLFPAGLVVANLLTIVVVINAVSLPWLQALVIGLLAALLVETHSIVPAGIYFCVYIMIVVVIQMFRGIVIWNRLWSWLVVFFLAELWLLALLTLTIDIAVDRSYLGKCLLALLGTTVVGLIIRCSKASFDTSNYS